MQRQRKNLKVYREEVKERQTTHWDLDYMNTADLEVVMAARRDWEKPRLMPAPRAISGFSRWLKRTFSFR